MKPSNRDSGRQIILINAALALVTFLVYFSTLKHDFVNYDDPDYVTSNEHVQSGLTSSSVVWAFKTGHASNWHPLTWLSHMLDCQMYGLNPGRQHLTNLLFHVANTLLWFAVLRRMTGAIWRSAIVTALFAWHPTHVESVAWISERKDVLSTFFWMVTMLAFVSWVKVGGAKAKIYYGLALLAFALGLMAKPMLVTLPFVLLLLDYWPLGRIADWRLRNADLENKSTQQLFAKSIAQVLVEKIPFVLLAMGSSVVTFMVQKAGGSVASLNVLTPGHRLANALVSYLRYVGKLFWPENLSVMYPMPSAWPTVLVVIAALFVLGVSVAVTMLITQRPYLFVGWFWFLGTLVPVIGLVQVGVQSMADRYLYVPAIGIFIMVVWSVADLFANRQSARLLSGAIAAIALAACIVVTVTQLPYWQNGETLFRHAIRVTKNNYLANNNLGFFLENHGKPNEAMEFYRKSVEINSNYEEAQNNIGHLLIAQGKFDEAILHLRQALKIKPSLVEARNNLGNALGDIGKLDEATAEYLQALQFKPDDVDAHNNLGIARAMQGKYSEAETLLREATRLKPSDVGAHSNLGNVLALEHKLDEAIQEYQSALRLNPSDAQVYFNLGNVLSEKGKQQEALDAYATAIKMQPTNGDAHYRLGLILARQGRQVEAVTELQEALRINPQNADARLKLNQLTNEKLH